MLVGTSFLCKRCQPKRNLGVRSQRSQRCCCKQGQPLPQGEMWPRGGRPLLSTLGDSHYPPRRPSQVVSLTATLTTWVHCPRPLFKQLKVKFTQTHSVWTSLGFTNKCSVSFLLIWKHLLLFPKHLSIFSLKKIPSLNLLVHMNPIFLFSPRLFIIFTQILAYLLFSLVLHGKRILEILSIKESSDLRVEVTNHWP